jgi:hypothetical protein
MNVVGRDHEIKILENLLTSSKPEFLAVYGRRRVGKTFLIREFFKAQQDVIFFNVSGAKNAPLTEQINHFMQQMGAVFYGGAELKASKGWDQAFEKLTKAFEIRPPDKKIVLFFDELPWMATKNSKLLSTLDYYWNQHWSNHKNLKLIICGSSASWIIQKIINSRGGLHNRITEKIALEPFNLTDTECFLHHSGIQLNRSQILQIYMAMGGIPYYLSKIKKGMSAAQIIESLAFSKKSFLLEEFDNLFSSLFEDGEVHEKLVKIIGKHRYGIGQRNLLQKAGKSTSGGGGVKKLKELEDAGFIERFKPLYHQKKGIYYRLIDEYTIFYLKWIEPIRDELQSQSLEPGNWQALQNTPEWYAWAGYAFEAVCYKHISAIRQRLALGVTALASSWRFSPTKGTPEHGAQIDLLFDRKDGAITLCEIKYTNEPFALTKEHWEALNRKIKVFTEKTQTKKQIFLALISANGIKPTLYSEEFISGLVILEDLFDKFQRQNNATH